MGIKEVANEAKVSIATVSHVINNTKPVTPKTKKKVLDAIEKLDFRINRAARDLKIGFSSIIAFIVADLGNPFFMQLALGIENSLKDTEYNLVVVNSDEKLNVEKDQIRSLMSQNVAGLIIAPTTNNHSYLNQYIPHDYPLIFVDRKPKGIKRDCVLSNNKDGAYKAICHLLKMGHKKIGIISGLIGLTTSVEREEGYKKALVDNNCQYTTHYTRNGDGRIESGYRMMQELFSDTDITAVFVTNNEMTIGALMFLKDNNVKIPKEMAIIGFDDYSWAPIAEPPLTTVRQKPYELGRKASDLILKNIGKSPKDCQYKEYRIESELVIRDSA